MIEKPKMLRCRFHGRKPASHFYFVKVKGRATSKSCREKRRASWAAYERTKKAAVRFARYRKTEKGRACDAVYELSVKGRLRAAVYKQTEKGRAAADRWRIHAGKV